MLLRLGVINVPTKVGADDWEQCFEETVERADIFGINEAFSPRAKRLYARLAKEHAYGKFGLIRSPNPVFYSLDRWRRTNGSIYRLHGRGPLYFRWPGSNESRYATVALYRSAPGHAAAPHVTHIHTHLVPRGPKVPEWWRTRARRRSIRVLSRIIDRHLALGHIVVVTGDFNMEFAPDLPRVTWVADSGVDKIGVACPRGWHVVAEQGGHFRAPTDHGHGVAVEVTLAPKEYVR